MLKEIDRYFSRHREVLDLVAGTMADRIAAVAAAVTDTVRSGGKVLALGNGGSAADAEHFASELVGRFLQERRGFPAVALTTNAAALTSIGNDYGFGDVFRRQVEALAIPGDLVLGISTSGSSDNVVRALEAARAAGCVTVGLLGRDGGRAAEIVDLCLTVPVGETPHIQEAHGCILHLICLLVEREPAL